MHTWGVLEQPARRACSARALLAKKGRSAHSRTRPAFTFLLSPVLLLSFVLLILVLLLLLVLALDNAFFNQSLSQQCCVLRHRPPPPRTRGNFLRTEPSLGVAVELPQRLAGVRRHVSRKIPSDELKQPHCRPGIALRSSSASVHIAAAKARGKPQHGRKQLRDKGDVRVENLWVDDVVNIDFLACDIDRGKA